MPFPRGNHWRATRGVEVITLIGTYHFDDPRHAATLDAITPALTSATTVLVEAGPEEEKALLDLIARGLSNKQIVETTGLSINSIKSFIRAAYRKIGVEKRADAIAWATEHGYGREAAS